MTQSPTANWSYPTAISFGAGRISELTQSCAAAGMTRPLLVTDKGLADLPITAAALDLMEAAGLGRGLFSDVDPNPNEKNCDAGVAAYRSGSHDGVIAFGGGSGLDLGKAVAFMAGQSRPIWDFEDVGDWWTRARRRRHRSCDCRADHGRHRLRGWPCLGHHKLGDGRKRRSSSIPRCSLFR